MLAFFLNDWVRIFQLLVFFGFTIWFVWLKIAMRKNKKNAEHARRNLLKLVYEDKKGEMFENKILKYVVKHYESFDRHYSSDLRDMLYNDFFCLYHTYNKFETQDEFDKVFQIFWGNVQFGVKKRTMFYEYFYKINRGWFKKQSNFEKEFEHAYRDLLEKEAINERISELQEGFTPRQIKKIAKNCRLNCLMIVNNFSKYPLNCKNVFCEPQIHYFVTSNDEKQKLSESIIERIQPCYCNHKIHVENMIIEGFTLIQVNSSPFFIDILKKLDKLTFLEER